MEQLGLTDMDEIAEVSCINKIEADIGTMAPVDLPLKHILTPDLYTRIIFMPANSLVVGMKHKTQHPYFIMKGKVECLKAKDDGTFEVEGLLETGYIGITTKGTKRLLRVLEDTVWAAVVANPNNIEDPDVIAETIMIEPEENPLVEKGDPRFNLWKKSISPSEIIKLLPQECLT
jgi:hypothetical protein